MAARISLLAQAGAAPGWDFLLVGHEFLPVEAAGKRRIRPGPNFPAEAPFVPDKTQEVVFYTYWAACSLEKLHSIWSD